MGGDHISLNTRKDEDPDYEFSLNVKSEDERRSVLHSTNISHSEIILPFHNSNGLFSLVITDGFSRLLSTLFRKVFGYLKKRITEKYKDIAVINRFIYKSGAILLSDINASHSERDDFTDFFNDPEFSAFFSKNQKVQGQPIDGYLTLLIKLILIWNDLQGIRQQPIKKLLKTLPVIVQLLRKDPIIFEWNRSQAMEWASVIDDALPWINFYDQQKAKPLTSIGSIINDLYEKRQDMLPGWLNQLIYTFENMFYEVKKVLSKIDGYSLPDYKYLIDVADEINRNLTFGERVKNVIDFYTQYDEEKAESLNKIKSKLSPETQSLLNEWQAAHKIKAWFSAEVTLMQDPATALKALETLTDQKKIAQLRTKAVDTQSEKWLIAYQKTSSEWFQPDSAMSVTLRTAIRLFSHELSWKEFLLLTAGEKNAHHLIWKAMRPVGELVMSRKSDNIAKLSRLAVLVRQFYEGANLADLLQQDMKQAVEGKSLLVDLASTMIGIDLSHYLEKQQWIQEAVEAIRQWRLSHNHDELLLQLSHLTAKQEGNVWWIAGILLKGIMLFRLWQSYRKQEADINLKEELLKLMAVMPENWLPWVLELCDWLPVLKQISDRRKQLPALSENQNWLSWSRQMIAEAGQNEDLLLKKIMPWIGGYQQHWLMNLLQEAGFKDFAGLAENELQRLGQPSADAMWGGLATIATQGRMLSAWINQTVGSAKSVALPLGTLIFLSQIAQANASGNMTSALSDSGNSTLSPQEEISGSSSGYLSVLPALAMAGGSQLYRHLGSYFNTTPTETASSDSDLQGRYSFETEMAEVNERLKNSSISWLPTMLLGGGLTGMLGGAAWATHTYYQTKKPQLKAERIEMMQMPTDMTTTPINESSVLITIEQEEKEKDKHKNMITAAEAKNKYIASGFMAGAGAVSLIAAGILYRRHQQDIQRKTELEEILEFQKFEKSDFTARVAKKLLELVGENFVTQFRSYDVRLAIEEVLTDDIEAEMQLQSIVSSPHRLKRSVPPDATTGNGGNTNKFGETLEIATDLSNDRFFIAALRNQLQATENDNGSGIRAYQQLYQYSGWEVDIGHNLNKKVVGMLNNLNYPALQANRFFLLKIVGLNNKIIYKKYYDTIDEKNNKKDFFEKINADIAASYLAEKNKVKIISVTNETYYTKRPLAVDEPANSSFNFFVVPEDSTVRSADWAVVTEHAKIMHDKVKANSPWITKTLQQKNDQYIRENYIAHESLKVDHTIGQSQYAESVINKIYDGIYHSPGAYVDDFKSEISSFVGSVFISDFSGEDSNVDLIDEKVTYNYQLIDVFDNASNNYISPRITVTETFWEYLLKRRDFFNTSETYVGSDGSQTNAQRSGTPLGRTLKIKNFKFVRFEDYEIPKKVLTLVNNDSYLRIEGEKYVNKAFKDDKFRVYSNLLMDIYLANALDKVIANDYAEGVSVPADRKAQYVYFAKKFRAGEGKINLLQHKNAEGILETGDRLILIPAINEGGYYLAISLGAGVPLQKEIKLERHEDGYHKVDNESIDFLKNFFPEGSLSKYKIIKTGEDLKNIHLFNIKANKTKVIWDKFYIQESSNPLEDLMSAHKQSRLDMVAYIFESQKELDAKNKKRIFDDLLTAFTIITFAIPVFEPLAIEMLALRGATVEIVNGIANITARILNVSSLGLSVMSSWEDYQSKKSRPKEAMKAWSGFVDTLAINILLASEDFFFGMPEKERYMKASEQIERDAEDFEASQIIENCKLTRDLFGRTCTVGAEKAANMASLYAAGNNVEDIDLSNCWNFVIDMQNKAKVISKKLSATLKSTTRDSKFTNYLGKDPIHITHVNKLTEIPAGARVAFTEVSSAGKEEMKHGMISIGNKQVIGINNTWLTTGGVVGKGRSVATIDLEKDITWVMEGLPLNKDGRDIKIYAQSLHDLKNPEALSEIYNNVDTFVAPERYTAQSPINVDEKKNILSNITLGDDKNNVIKENFLRGKSAAKRALGNGTDVRIIEKNLGVIGELNKLEIDTTKSFYHGNGVPEDYAKKMRKGDLLQSHELTSISDSKYIARHFSELSDGEEKVIYEIESKDSGFIGEIIPWRDAYTEIKNHYESLGPAVQNEVMTAKEGIILPGAVYRIKSVGKIELAETQYRLVKLEYIHKNDMILPVSFNGPDFNLQINDAVD